MPVLKRKIFRGIFILISVIGLVSFTQMSATREYQIKAVFLFNFTQFVEWPAASFPTVTDPMVIGVLGANPFGSYLSETIAGENVNGHPLVVQNFNTIDEVKTCHVIFLNLKDDAKLKQAIEVFKGRKILTVCDAPNFLQQGGMIRFYTKNNKIQLQINLDVVKAANLSISSKLLRLADIYSGK